MSFDAMLTFLPVLLMVVYTTGYADFLNKRALAWMHQQTLHDKLVSISELVVNELAAAKTAGLGQMADSVKPNWIDEGELDRVNREDIRKGMGLASLAIGWQPKGKNCIYRIVAVGEQREIRQLFICGG